MSVQAIGAGSHAIAGRFSLETVNRKAIFRLERVGRSAAALGWGTAELIETDDAGKAQYPQIAVDPNGSAIAVWEQYEGGRLNVWANRWE